MIFRDFSPSTFPPFQISRSIYITLQSSLIGRFDIQLFCKFLVSSLKGKNTHIYILLTILHRVSSAKQLDIDSQPRDYEKQQKTVFLGNLR